MVKFGMTRKVAAVVAVALVAVAAPTAAVSAAQSAPDSPATPAVVTPQSTQFTDVPPTASFAQGVAWLVDEEITEGQGGPGKYSPANPVNRGQMALFLWRMMGRAAAPTECGFTDMASAPADMRQAACWLKQQGVTTGASATRYDRVSPVNRGQMALFLSRLAGATGSAPCGFTDATGNAELDNGACWLKANGITTGTNPAGTVYSPGQVVTRGQMAAFLFRQAAAPEAWNIARLTPAAYGCEVLDVRSCMLPFPSDHFTTPDASTDTGLRLNFERISTPVNKDGVRIDPTEQNRNDGFSPGQALLTYLPGVDLAASGAAPVNDMGRSLDTDAPVLLINATTGERHPHWVEYDTHASSDADRLLSILPARNFDEGTRYLVALRNLVDNQGNPVPARPAFDALRNGTPTGASIVDARIDEMQDLLGEFTDFGYDPDEFVLAWDFTVASERNLSERMLHIRDDAFATLAGGAPSFTATRADATCGSSCGYDANRIVVNGTYQVPNYQAGTATFNGRPFNWGPDGLPVRNPQWSTLTVPFRCVLPSNSVVSTANPATMSMYGHGLLGNYTEVGAGNVKAFADEHNVMFCATWWAGFAGPDVPNAVVALNDLSKFNAIADGAQQGFVNQLFLGRLMRHANGFSATTAFRSGGQPLIDRTSLSYDGNSQGGIMGGALTAVSTEFTRAVLGVPGMNYSTLLYRSSDFPTYAIIFNGAYRNEIERLQALGFTQLLWDRAEANGYAHHLTDDPYPGTPAHEVLLHVAYADHQVAIVTADVMARTAGIKLFDPPAVNPDRAANVGFEDRLDVEPFWGIDRLTTGEIEAGFTGSVYVMWDSGNTPPPVENVPPGSDRFNKPDVKPDPHSEPRAQATARAQKYAFFGGSFLDVCGGAPCLAPFR